MAALLPPALQRNSTLHSFGIPASEHRDGEKEGEKKEERLYSALCHWQQAQELNAANPRGTKECENAETLWQREDNISSTVFNSGEVNYKQGCLEYTLYKLFPVSMYLYEHKH